MPETTITRSPLLPDRHPAPDFFVCDLVALAPKSDLASLEHPIFSLSTKPDRTSRRYEHGDVFVEIKPSADGLATVHDRDVLIYCISVLMAARKQGREISRTLRFRAHDLLQATNRPTNGGGYSRLRAALERLSGTRITTNVVTGGTETLRGFGLIDEFEMVRETRDGRLQEVEVKLSEWLMRAVESREVLTLHRDYFRLRKPIERRLYELARKHCGRQREWRVSLALLQKKCGATSSSREFRRLVGQIAHEDQQHAHLPDYAIELDEDDFVTFQNRNTMPALETSEQDLDTVKLTDDAYERAREAAPGWDVYVLENEWRGWMTERPRNPDAAFVGFCRKWHERRGSA